MRQRHPIFTVLLLAAASVAGIMAQLVVSAHWSTLALAIALAPLCYALAARRR